MLAQILGAPVFFPTVWGWIKNWFDPITVSKIFILSASEVKSTLAEYIDPAHIPQQYGGDLPFTFGDQPLLDPAIADRLEWSEPPDPTKGRIFPPGPARWVDRTDKAQDAVFVGTVAGQRRKETFALMPALDEADPAVEEDPTTTPAVNRVASESVQESVPSEPPMAEPVERRTQGEVEVIS